MRLLSLSLLLFAAPTAFADTYVYVSAAGDKKILVYRLDPADGKLTAVGATDIAGEPAALITDPQRRFLFASIRSEGNLSAFRLDAKTGKLTHINTVAAGPDPAHISMDKDGTMLFTAYYVAAKVTSHRVGKDGALSKAPWQSLPTADKAHAIVLDPSNRFAFVPHTGPNLIHLFAYDAKTAELRPLKPLQTPPKTGPRHLVFHPSKDIAYVDNEQGGSVTAYALDKKAGALSPLQTVSTLPAAFKGTNACSEIRIHPSGQFLYVANRGHDSIACFRVGEDGKLTATGHAMTERTPRGFDLDPTGKYLYAAGESSGKLAAYRVDGKTGLLERIATYDVGRMPWWVMAVNVPAKE